MEFAYSVDMIPNAFSPYPLEGDDLFTFFDYNTMIARTGGNGDSPMLDIYDRCKDLSAFNKMLLLGHRGCGKSSELNYMASKLRDEGYAVHSIDCRNELNLTNMVYTDILILLGDALLSIVDSLHVDLPLEIRGKIYNFWRREGEETSVDESEYDILTEGGLSAETPSLLNILKVFVNVKANVKQNETKRIVYKMKIERRSKEWELLINSIADSIATVLDGKYPIVIFEELDKLDTVAPEKAWDLFSVHGNDLNSYSFPIIYTFPISLSYDARYTSVDNYFEPFIMPMIKIRSINGEPYSIGKGIIMDIIEKRTKADLFDDDVLNFAITKTGGSLRDLFSVISRAATFARRNKRSTVSMGDVVIALEKVKGEITKRIDGEQHDFLVNVYNGVGNHRKIENKKMLLEMITANAVLEYNGQRWYDVHPLVADYLIDDLHMTTRRENDR